MSQKISTTILPKLTLMASDLTLKGLFAMNAPDVPDWFETITGYENDCPYEILEERYFKWRWYYADKMIEEENKKNK